MSNGKTMGAASAAPIVVPDGATLADLEAIEQAAYDAIKEVQDPAEAEELLSKVKMAEDAARFMKLGAEREQRWGGLRLRAERRWGELLGSATIGGQRDGHVSGTNVTNPERFAQHQARKVAAVSKADFESYLDSADKPSRTGLLRAAVAAGAAAARRKKPKKTLEAAEAQQELRARSKDIRALPSDQRPRWTEYDADLVDAVLAIQPRRRKYSGKRLRELASKRRKGDPYRLANLQYRMMQLTSILESVDVADYELSDVEDVEDFHDDLVELQIWMDRSISLASSRLDDAALERKIRKLRDGSGRTEAEQRTAVALADKLERRRRGNRLGLTG